ncbi:MAG: chromosomal replication initiator protein DnaA [Gemmatimonadetes bacterium]|nr:chromosomal replication initiator protein DnaA [Gemmatimonadota bacterium]
MSLLSGELWAELQQELAPAMGDGLTQTWLAPLAFEQVDDRVFRIRAPGQFHAERVERLYGAPLRQRLRERFGPEVRLEFVSTAGSAERSTTADPIGSNGHDHGMNGNGTTSTPRVAPAAPVTPADETVARFDDAVARATRAPGREPAHLASNLYRRYRFEHFVVGKSNQFAHAASRGVAEHPGEAYNPLFIFGGSGLGKTHIMQAIGNHLRESSSNLVVHYTSAENFMNEMIGAIQSGQMVAFRNKWRNLIDILLIDDVQFLQNKESTQEEFFHTFNALHGAHKQIVLTSDRPPNEIPNLEERLVSRFNWGLVTDIQPPDLETRIAILRQKAREEQLTLDDSVLEIIATNVRSNIRELEGSLVRLLAYASLNGREIDAALALEVLKDFIKQPTRLVTIEQIQKIVADLHGIPEEAMKVKKRTSSLAYPRQIAMYLSRELTELSLADIGARFGGRDHTTVMHAHDKISRQKEDDPELRRVLQKVTKLLQDQD